MRTDSEHSSGEDDRTVADTSWRRLAGAPVVEGYEIVRSMGAGGMGEVFLAKDVTLGRHVAIKTISSGGSAVESSRARFGREARSMAALEHPNIARLYSFGALEDETQYLVMEFVDGISLRDKIRKEGKLSIDEALSITRQVVFALSAAWEKKIVHRDIKPGNILIDNKNRVRVVDFGLAKATEYETADEHEQTLTQEGFLLGTPHYISPEQANGFPLDYGTDIYSLGIVLFEMLTGKRPFQGPTPLSVVSGHLNSSLPPLFESRVDREDEVEKLVERMTAKNRVDRPSYEEILAIIDDLIGPPSWESTTPIPRRIRSRGRWAGIPESAEPVVVSVLIFCSASIIAQMVVIPWLAEALDVLSRPLFIGVLSAGLLLVAGASALGGYSYVSWLRTRRRRGVRRVLSAVPWAVAILVVFMSITPRIFNVLSEEEIHSGSLLTFGPYPDAGKLDDLRRDGYSGVVSLLHPAVFPVETVLLQREKGRVSEAGLTFSSIPVLPWVSDQAEQLDAFERFLRDHPGRYYVHAYVDRDRLERAESVVQKEEESGLPAETTLFQPPILQLERGPVSVLDNGKYLIPFPTADEMKSFYLGGRVREVVSLLDPAIESNVGLIREETEFLDANGIEIRSFPLGSVDQDPLVALEAARYVKDAAPPVAVHGFRVPAEGSDAAAEAFIQAYHSNRLPLAPSLFTVGLSGGLVEVIAPNIAIGPRPTGPEYGSYLSRRGIRRFIFVGEQSSPAAVEDSRVTGENKLSWRLVDPDRDALLPLLRTGGPYYLYGPELDRVVDAVRNRYGPAIPTGPAQSSD